MMIYTVKRGDTVWSIAQAYGVSPQRLIMDNGIADPRHLVPGQAILVLVPAVTYTAQPGDTLASIAAGFDVPLVTLLQNNPEFAGGAVLQPGQQLAIRFRGEKRRTVFVNGYAYPHIRREVLVRTLPYLTYLTIFGYGFQTDGSLLPVDDQPLIDLAYQYRTAPVLLLSSVTEDGGFSTEKASTLFRSAALQNTVLDNLIAVMLEKGYMGLDADFEYVAADDAEAYLRFLENAAARLRPYGFFLHTDLAPKTSGEQSGLLYEAHDYPRIGAVSDTVLLMTYEWGYTYGPPMAVAPLPQVREVVRYGNSAIPSEKIMMGIPNYGYDWPLPYVKGETRAVSVGNQYAVALAAQNGAEIRYDDMAQSPYFEYWSGGHKHIVWFEDVRSIHQKFMLADQFSLRGFGYWNIMRPFAQNWVLLAAQYTIQKII